MGAPFGSLPELIPLEFCLLICFEKLQIQLVFLGYLFDSLPYFDVTLIPLMLLLNTDFWSTFA